MYRLQALLTKKHTPYTYDMEDSRTNPTVYLDVAIGGRPGTSLANIN